MLSQKPEVFWGKSFDLLLRVERCCFKFFGIPCPHNRIAREEDEERLKYLESASPEDFYQSLIGGSEFSDSEYKGIVAEEFDEKFRDSFFAGMTAPKKALQELFETLSIPMAKEYWRPAPNFLVFGTKLPSCPLRKRFPDSTVDYLGTEELPAQKKLRFGDSYALKLLEYYREAEKQYDFAIIKDLDTVVPDSDPSWMVLMLSFVLRDGAYFILLEDPNKRGSRDNVFQQSLQRHGFQFDHEEFDGGNRVTYFQLLEKKVGSCLLSR
ncbi:MAG: hypothetical protein ACI8RA_000398 [Chlamydiales bacterium]|jgi:hypothetical protein